MCVCITHSRNDEHRFQSTPTHCAMHSKHVRIQNLPFFDLGDPIWVIWCQDKNAVLRILTPEKKSTRGKSLFHPKVFSPIRRIPRMNFEERGKWILENRKSVFWDRLWLIWFVVKNRRKLFFVIPVKKKRSKELAKKSRFTAQAEKKRKWKKSKENRYFERSKKFSGARKWKTFSAANRAVFAHRVM